MRIMIQRHKKRLRHDRRDELTVGTCVLVDAFAIR